MEPPESPPLPSGVALRGDLPPGAGRALSPEASAFAADLARHFRPRVEELLSRRRELQGRWDAGERPRFLAETEEIRAADWSVAPAPAELQDRVEIPGPPERRAIIAGLASGANVFVADFADSTSPTWKNVVEGHANLKDAVERTLEWVEPGSGEIHRLREETAVLMVRPRGWHAVEGHVLVDGAPVPAALWDAGIFLFHGARTLIARRSGPYLHLPGIEHHLEARLWNEVLVRAEDGLRIPRGSIRASAIVEDVAAAFQMDEILWELRERSAGLGFGRFAYLASIARRFRNEPGMVLPDRAELDEDPHCLRACVQLLVQTAHRRGAPAIGLDAQVPGRGREEAKVSPRDLLRPPEGARTEAGLRRIVRASVQWLEAWLRGTGALAIHGRWEDAASVDLCRAIAWQWVRHGVVLDEGRPLGRERFRSVLGEEMDRIRLEVGDERFEGGRFEEARSLFERESLSPELADRLAIPAYELLEAPPGERAAVRAVEGTRAEGSPAAPDRPGRIEHTPAPEGPAGADRLPAAGNVGAPHAAEQVTAVLDEDHGRLHGVIDRLESARDAASLVVSLDELSQMLREHFALEEHAKGFYGILKARSPEHRADLSRMVAEHGEILEAIGALRERAREPFTTGDLSEAAQEIVRRIQAHEAREKELVKALT